MEEKEIKEITGFTCKRGREYAKKEVTHPTRIVTSTVRVTGGNIAMVSVKTASDIPKEKIMEIMECIQDIRIPAPVHIGDVILENVAGTNVNIVATKNVACA
jgi:CxxC motif-containing protein